MPCNTHYLDWDLLVKIVYRDIYQRCMYMIYIYLDVQENGIKYNSYCFLPSILRWKEWAWILLKLSVAQRHEEFSVNFPLPKLFKIHVKFSSKLLTFYSLWLQCWWRIFLFLRLTIKQINVANFIHGKLLIKIDGFYNKKGCKKKGERKKSY